MLKILLTLSYPALSGRHFTTASSGHSNPWVNETSWSLLADFKRIFQCCCLSSLETKEYLPNCFIHFLKRTLQLANDKCSKNWAMSSMNVKKPEE